MDRYASARNMTFTPRPGHAVCCFRRKVPASDARERFDGRCSGAIAAVNPPLFGGDGPSESFALIETTAG